MKVYYLIPIGLAIVTVGCSESENSEQTQTALSQTQHMMVTESENKMTRKMDFAQITRGGNVYKNNCMSCHGANAEGNVDWRKTDAEGKYPAPPLNGTGHAWHHSNKVNANTIWNGTKHIGGNMPAWKDKLSEEEVIDVIAWFQSKWSDEVYQTWVKNFEK